MESEMRGVRTVGWCWSCQLRGRCVLVQNTVQKISVVHSI